MRKKIVAGNWKMNLSHAEALELVDGVLSNLNDIPGDVQVIFFPSYPYLKQCVDLTFDAEQVFVGAQNVSEYDKGAYTGEVAATMLTSLQASHVLIGHSERREYFGENHEILLAKLQQALKNDLLPVYCCGENLEDRESGSHFSKVKEQLDQVLFQLNENQMKQVVVAYEPVWAIGTGKTASSEQAQEMHAFIRSQIQEQFGTAIAENLSILYGGSCKPDNANELFDCNDVDGGLIGGASLKIADFTAIIKAIM